MIALTLISLAGVALAAEPEPIWASAQPLADTAALIDRLGTLCGSVTTKETLAEIVLVGEWCDGSVLPDGGRFTIQTTASVTEERKAALSAAEIEEVTALDTAILGYLGFDLSEFGDISTLEVISDTGTEESRRWIGTTTIVERYVGDAWIPGSRVTVSRNASGAVADVTATWPAFDLNTLYSDTESSMDDAGYAAALGVERDELRWTRPVLVPLVVTGGHVDEVHRRVAVTWRVAGPDDSHAFVGVYFEDGAPIWAEEAR